MARIRTRACNVKILILCFKLIKAILVCSWRRGIRPHYMPVRENLDSHRAVHCSWGWTGQHSRSFGTNGSLSRFDPIAQYGTYVRNWRRSGVVARKGPRRFQIKVSLVCTRHCDTRVKLGHLGVMVVINSGHLCGRRSTSVSLSRDLSMLTHL